MMTNLIRWSLANRAPVVALALLLCAGGALVAAGMPVDESTELYLAFQRSSRLGEQLDPLGEPPTNQLVAGGRRTRPSGTSVWAENAYHVHEGAAGGERVTTRTVGAEVPLGGALRLSFHYQRGAVETELGGLPRVLEEAAEAVRGLPTLLSRLAEAAPAGATGVHRPVTG